MSDVASFLEESEAYPAFKFENVGDAIAGTIVSNPRLAEVSKLGTTTGETVTKLLINLETPAGIFTVWVNRGNQGRAVSEAVKAAGARELEVGGKLMISFTGIGQAKQAGYNPPKLYEARYKAPAAPAPQAQAVASFFQDDAAQNAPAQPQAQPAAQPAPASPPAQAQAVGSWED